MNEADTLANAARNKANYLKAKAAFNDKDMAACMEFYALDHQVMSRKCEKGRHEIEAFLTAMHDNWDDLQVIVEHAVAEGDWVMGRSRSVATHNKTVLGKAPTGEIIETTFWDLHRFNDQGMIVETWNLTDNLAVMQQLGLIASPG